jgi:hypothetical protein
MSINACTDNKNDAGTEAKLPLPTFTILRTQTSFRSAAETLIGGGGKRMQYMFISPTYKLNRNNYLIQNL